MLCICHARPQKLFIWNISINWIYTICNKLRITIRKSSKYLLAYLADRIVSQELSTWKVICFYLSFAFNLVKLIQKAIQTLISVYIRLASFWLLSFSNELKPKEFELKWEFSPYLVHSFISESKLRVMSFIANLLILQITLKSFCYTVCYILERRPEKKKKMHVIITVQLIQSEECKKKDTQEAQILKNSSDFKTAAQLTIQIILCNMGTS